MTHSTEIITPARLSTSERESLTESLYAAHCRIFDGVDADEFSRYVVCSPAHRTRILVIRDADGIIRGYCAFHVFLERINGRPTAIIRMETGVERALRKQSLSGPFIISEILQALIRYPLHRLMFMACFVHPSAYVALHRHAPKMWPSPREVIPEEVEATMGALARHFKLKPASQPGTYEVGWVTRDACRPRRISPTATYYMSRNPNYTRGEGLLTVIPLSTGLLLQSTGSYLSFRLQRLRPQGAHPASKPLIESER